MNQLAWMCIALGVMLFIQTIRQWRAQHKLEDCRKTSSRLIHGLHMEKNELERRDQVQAYNELEKGMDEQQESFEQEYLTWDEQKTEFLEIIHEKNLEINQWVEDVRLLLGLVYDYEEVTLTGPVTKEQVANIHERQRVS